LNHSLRILIALSLGLVGGILYSMGDGQTLASLPTIVEPIGTLWVNAIRMTVIPLIVALLVTSIAGERKSRLIVELGGKMIGLFVIMVAAASLYTLILAPPLLSLLDIDPAMAAVLLDRTGMAGVATTELPQFRDWFVGLIPANPFKAATDGAILPLVVFAVLFSIALLRVEGEGKDTVLRFFQAIKEAMFVLIGWIMLLAPIGIFALIFPLAARMGLSAMTLLGSFIVIACGLVSVMMLLLYPLTVVVGRVPLAAFARAVAPVQVIGFSTRSSLASLPAIFRATENLGISSRVSGLVLPVAASLFKFGSPIGRIAGTYFIAHLYGIELGPTELLIIAMAIGLFSFYSPGIPSGGLLIIAPVFISLGLPVEGIGILIAIDLIVDMFLTATNVTASVTVAAILSREDRR
jgi:proton glutamate symport protein